MKSAKGVKKWKHLIEFLNDLGFEEQRKSKHGLRWKHPNRGCIVQLASNPGDPRAFKQAKTQIKKILTQDCKPSYNPNDFEKYLSSVRVQLQRANLNTRMDSLDDILDIIFTDAENYQESTLTTKLETRYKDRLKNIAQRKGIPIGEVIEEMIERYEW